MIFVSFMVCEYDLNFLFISNFICDLYFVYFYNSFILLVRLYDLIYLVNMKYGILGVC